MAERFVLLIRPNRARQKVFSVRPALEANPKHPRYIQTVHGFGYKFKDE
ncbi:MAG: winged helix-turn-helix domain-containing protein [Pyrinomonadaceae bacterium]